MSRGTLAIVAGVIALSIPRSADACSYAGASPHQLDPAQKGVDTTPPSAISEITYTVDRGNEPKKEGCTRSAASSCDDIGGITLHLGEVSDDHTERASLGYRIEVIAGKAPKDSTWPPTDPVRAFDDDTLSLHWLDGEDDDQEAIDFTLRIRAVDLAGNEGPPSEVRIKDDGSDGGCRTAPRSLDLSWGLIALGFGFLARRCRWRSPPTKTPTM